MSLFVINSKNNKGEAMIMCFNRDMHLKLGKYEIKRGNYQLAEELLKPLVDLDDVDAMTELGWAYIQEKRYSDAFDLYKRAYEEEETGLTLYNYANCFYNGIYVEKDYEKAFELFKQSAYAGHINGYYRVAKMYEEGKGTRRDMNLAIFYAKMGANITIEDNDPSPNCLTQLAIYLDPHFNFGKPDLECSRYYYREAIKRGDSVAKNNYANILLFDDKKKTRYALKLLREAALDNSFSAINLLTSIYEEGLFGESQSQTLFDYWIDYGINIGNPESLLYEVERLIEDIELNEATILLASIDKKDLRTSKGKKMYEALSTRIEEMSSNGQIS